jgi:hypothetical protein
MKRFKFLPLSGLSLAALVLVVGCKKEEAATPAQPATPPPAAAEPPKPAEPATKPIELPKAATMPEAVSVFPGNCPSGTEDPAACPKKPATVDDNIKVAHVLVGWNGSLPGKKVDRTEEEAKKLAEELMHQARQKDTDFIQLIWKHSADGGPGVYEVTPPMRRRFVPEFTSMALSLGEGQVDVVKTRFGFHVMKRMPFGYVPPEKPIEKVVTDACPAEGEDPASCPAKLDAKPAEVEVTHILVAYAGAMRSQATRTKDEAKALAIKLCHDGRKKGADFNKIKEAAKSDDPGPGTYPVSADAPMVPPFKALALSLGVGQVDVVETDFGYHVMKRNK